jgi:hypothetical protein
MPRKSSGPPTLVWATVDQEMGRALLTGRNVGAMLKSAGIHASWSFTWRGWMVNIADLSDIATWCDVQRIPYRERRRRA